MSTERQIGEAVSLYIQGRLTGAALRVRIDRLLAEDPEALDRLRS